RIARHGAPARARSTRRRARRAPRALDVLCKENPHRRARKCRTLVVRSRHGTRQAARLAVPGPVHPYPAGAPRRRDTDIDPAWADEALPTTVHWSTRPTRHPSPGRPTVWSATRQAPAW